MKAHVFILQGQKQSLYKEIKLLLEDEFCRSIEIECIEIDPKYGRRSSDAMHKSCRDYLNFLRASFVVISNSFEIIIKNDQETDWYYLGYSYSTPPYGYCFELKHMQMTSLFPAVAIMERIVMLPEEFYQNTDVHPRTFLSLPRPLNFSGVELVDYHDKGTIKHAVSRVAAQFKQEWKNLCHRHMGIHGLFKPNFEELSRLLHVDSLLLESSSLFSSDVNLKVSVVEGQAVEGTLSHVVLEISNKEEEEGGNKKGGRALKNIRIRVRAPSGALASPVSEMCDLLPPEPARLELKLTPKTAPICPLEVFIDMGDDPSAIPSFPIPVHVEVLPRNFA
jgi:hypothetical protein